MKICNAPSLTSLISRLFLVGSAAEAFLFQYVPQSYHYDLAFAASINVSTECSTTCEDINVDVIGGDSSNNKWPTDVSKTLSKFGVCVLMPSSTSTSRTAYSGLISKPSCDAVNAVATEHLANLHRKIENRGIDPSGVEDGPYRFREVVCRDGSPRFDVPIPVSHDEEATDGDNYQRNKLGDFIDDGHACETINKFHQEVDAIVQPVVDALWGSEIDTNNNSEDHGGAVGRATSAGFLVNQPGSTSQKWHRDGPADGFINAFIPLVDLDESLGPTAILPGTHMMPGIRMNNEGSERDNGDMPLLITPMLKKGQVLLFDYRTLHKGLGNYNLEGVSRTLAYVVYTRGSITDVHNFPDALTLEYD